MRASVLTDRQRIAVEERAVPVPEADQVLVRVGSVGVCGSDVHFYTDGALGDWRLEGPLVLGHVSGGTIVAVGDAVDPGRVGERVSIEPQRPSPTSAETLSGRYNLDPHMEFYAVPGVDGAFQEYVTIQAHFAHPVPASVSDDAAGLMEPLSVAIATARKAGFTVGSRVLISGAGPIGVVTAQVARAFGASEVLVTDIDPGRRERATRFGATTVLDPGGDDFGRAGLRVDAFVEASGAAAAVATGMREVRPAGTVVLVGMGPEAVSVPVPAIQNNELQVTGVFRYANTWPTAIELVRSGRVDLDAMVTGHYGLDEVEEALRSTAESQTLKSVVRPQG
jgi:L-iditol 2-dehydrogenase